MAELADCDMEWPLVAEKVIYSSSVIGLRRDTLCASDGGTFDRDVIEHRGAVGVVAIDERERLLVVTQYRHPPRQRMVELPAGLLDSLGEKPCEAARRELAEEGHVGAERWSKLLDLVLSPGVSDEVMTIYLAEGISKADVPTGFLAEHEEATMTRDWVPLIDVVDAVLTGRVKNAALVAGSLAAWVRRRPAASEPSARIRQTR